MQALPKVFLPLTFEMPSTLVGASLLANAVCQSMMF